MAFAAQNGGRTSYGEFFPDLAVGGPADERLRLDAAGGRVADVGVLRVASGAQGETRNQNSKLGEPEDFDVRAGGGICPDSPLVDSGGAAFGENDVDPVAVSRVAVRDFLGRDSDCGYRAVLQGGDAEFAAGQWEDFVVGEPGSAGDLHGAHARWLVPDVAALGVRELCSRFHRVKYLLPILSRLLVSPQKGGPTRSVPTPKWEII